MTWIAARLRLALVALVASSTTVAWLGLPAAAQAPAPAVAEPPTAEQAEFFETTIRPLLAGNCYACHSARVDTPFGGLRLDSRAGCWPAAIQGRPSCRAARTRARSCSVSTDARC